MPFGYGMSINLLQLASAYSVFANDGIHITPKLYLNKKPEIGDKILTPKTSNTMKNFMVSVVEEDGGTGFKARIPGYTVAGKTGTARKVVEGNYVKEYVASFVGIAPSTNPKFIMAVMIDNPRVDSYYGGTVAGPVFKDTMKDALKLYDIPHDKDIKENLLEITNNNTDNEKL
jgi:cell division protein FtsI (penicillin-binding protein 3)